MAAHVTADDIQRSPTASAARLNGTCLCERVAVTLDLIVPYGMKCYCTFCRKVSGSAFAAVVLTRPRHWSIERGREQLASFEATPATERWHCRVCFAHVYTEVRDRPEVPIFVSAALFEPTHLASVRFDHIFVKSAPAWHVLSEDGAPRHPSYPDPG